MGTFAFGPIPSRRLGKSLGINNIPLKHCTYSCVYCQLGKTTDYCIERKDFYDPDAVCMEVERKVDKALQSGWSIDYLTFVPD
ncbi:MAG: radical SAM protein, partial [Thermoproteota archaeon]